MTPLRNKHGWKLIEKAFILKMTEINKIIVKKSKAKIRNFFTCWTLKKVIDVIF